MAEFSTHFDDADNPEARRECERLADLMTAFFDGETEAEETRLARQHLIECARCAMSWEVWQRTRYLLQSSPVPPVPVGLLVRILLACRLSALPRRAKKSGMAISTQPASFKTHDTEMLGALRDEVGFACELAPAHTSHPLGAEAPAGNAPLRALLPTVPVPPHLKDEILKRTVGRTLDNSPGLSQVAAAHPARQWPKLPRWDFGLASPRRATQFAALAVPATLAWLLVVTPRLSGPVLVASLPPAPTPAALPQKTSIRALHRLAKLSLAPALATRPAAVALTASTPAQAQPAVAPVTPAASDAPSVEVATPDAHPLAASYERATLSVNRASGATAETLSAPSVAKPVVARPLPQLAAPRLTLATMPMKWSRSNQSVAEENTQSGSRNLRAAVLNLDDQVRQPQSNDTSDDSDPADDISDISDHRPAEARQAIDSYRAALLSDAPAGDAATSDSSDDSGTDG